MEIKSKFQTKQASILSLGGSQPRRERQALALALVLSAGMNAVGAFAAHAQVPNTSPATANRTADKCDSILTSRIAAQIKSGKTDGATISGWSSVIIRLKDDTLDANREKALTALGSDIYRRLSFIGSVAVRIPNRNLEKLVSLPFVAHISMDDSVKKNDEFTVQTTGADVAYSQYGADGSGVGVAVLDSGIYNHYDLRTNNGASRIVASVSFTGDGSVGDTCGHGTHIAGIIAGNGGSSSNFWNTRTFYGIARNTSLINVRVLDGQGQGSVSGVISGINWVIQHKAAYNIRVINLSLGHAVTQSYVNDPLCQAAEAAYRAGIVVVCAAGNNGRASLINIPGANNEGWGTAYGSIQSPGNDPYVITVGAMKDSPTGRSYDRIATYSSRGPSRVDGVLKPDIVAPGNRVISTLANDSYLDILYSLTNSLPISAYTYIPITSASTRYFYLSGTSMAAPVVAGAAALLIQKDPTLSPDTVKARLMLSADKWGNADGSYDACTYGAGYLNIPAALNNRVVASRSAASPMLSRDSVGNVIVDRGRSIWGNTQSGVAIWGIPNLTNLQVLWGTGAVANAQVIWNNQVLWGSVITNSVAVNGSQVLWGGGPNDDAPPTPTPPATDTPTDGPPAVDLSSTTIQGER